MSAIDIFTRTRAAENSHLFRFGGKLADRVRSYTSYRRTLTALEKLTDPQLADLGLSRYQIPDVAYRAAYDH